MDFETSLLKGLDKESLEILGTRPKKSLEDKLILINTYLDILEINNAKKLLQLVKKSIKTDMKNKALNDLILTFFDNKLEVVRSNYNLVLKNLESFDLSNYTQLNPRERTFLLLILFVKGEASLKCSKYTKTEKILDLILSAKSLANNYKSTLTDEVILGLYHRLSFIHNYYKGDTDKASNDIYEGLEIYSKANNAIYLAYFYNFHGIIAGMKGDFLQSLESYQKSLDYFESISNKNGIFRINYSANIYNNMSSILREQGRIPEAIRLIENAIEIFENNDIHGSITIYYDTLGILYRDLGEYELSESYFYKSYSIRKQIADPIEISDSLLNIAILEEKTGRLNPDSIAVQEFPKKIDSNLVLLNKLIIEGLVYFSQKDYENALLKLNEAFTIEGIEFSDRLLIIDYKADIFLEKNDYQNFSDHLRIWKILAKENNLLPSLFKAYLIDFRFELLFLNFESAKNSIEEAYELAKKYSPGAVKLVQENKKLLENRQYLMKKAQEKDTTLIESNVKQQELLEIKKYINEITSFITKFDESGR